MEISTENKNDHLLRIFTSLEFFCLCFLALMLPLLEAPKNIASLLYLIVWVARLATLGTHGLKKTSYDLIIAVFLGGNIIATIGAASKGYDTSDIVDIVRYSLIAWMLLHTTLSRKQILALISLLLLSALLGTAQGYWDLLQGNKQLFELHSVGHVNHSSIYLLLITGAILPFMLNNKFSRWKKIITAISLLVLLLALFETNSRATFIGFVFILAVLFAVSMKHHRKLASLTFAIVVVFTVYSIWNTPPIINKFIAKSHAYGNQLKPREKLWNVAYAVWKKEPVFGIGYGSYKGINAQRLQRWYKGSDIDFSDDSHYMYLSHAHNRYLHTLAEGGLIGLFSLLFLLAGATFVLWNQRTALQRPGDRLSFWLVGFNTLSAITIVGLFNTTLHHEHALLSMMLLMLSYKAINLDVEETHQT